MNKNHPSAISEDALEVLETLTIALGIGMATQGIFTLMQGYETGDDAQKRRGMDMLLAGGDIAYLTPLYLRTELALRGGLDDQWV